MDKNAIQLINCTYLILLIGASAGSFYVTITQCVIRSRLISHRRLPWRRRRLAELHMYNFVMHFAVQKNRTNKRKASISGIWIIRLPHARHIVRHNRRQQRHRQPTFPRTKRKKKKCGEDSKWWFHDSTRIWLLHLFFGLFSFLVHFTFFPVSVSHIQIVCVIELNCSKMHPLHSVDCGNAFQRCGRANKRMRFSSNALHKNVIHLFEKPIARGRSKRKEKKQKRPQIRWRKNLSTCDGKCAPTSISGNDRFVIQLDSNRVLFFFVKLRQLNKFSAGFFFGVSVKTVSWFRLRSPVHCHSKF